MKIFRIGFLAVLFLGLAALPAAGFSPDDVNIHGFISQGYLLSDDNNFLAADTSDGTFQFNELGINFSADLAERLRVGVQFFSRDQGAIGNNDVVVDWAYGDYRWRDWLGVRAGIMRQAYGFYNETRDLDMLRNSILLPQGIYNENFRGAFSRLQGGSIYGDIGLGGAGNLSYQFVIGTSNTDPDGGVARQIEGAGGFDVQEFDNGVTYNGGLIWDTPLSGLRVGASGVTSTDLSLDVLTTAPIGPLPPGAPLTFDIDHIHSYVFSAEYTWENLVLAVEYMFMELESGLKEIPGSEQTQKPEGFYLSATYRFNDWFEAGSYYSVYHEDRDDRDGDDLEAQGRPDYRAWLNDFALTARFDITPNWVFKLEGHAMDGAALLMSQDHPDGYEKNWYLLAAKATFSF